MFELSWKKTDGTEIHYWNLSGNLVQNTILMDVALCPDMDASTIKIRGQRVPARAYFVNDDGETVYF